MTIATQIHKGQRVYLEDGTAAEYIDAHAPGHLVNVIYKYTDFEGYDYDDQGPSPYYSEIAVGHTIYVARVFLAEPTPVVAHSIKAAEEKLDTLQATIRGLNAEITTLKQSKENIEKELRATPNLSAVMDFLNKRISHFVMIGYGTPKIATYDEAMRTPDDWHTTSYENKHLGRQKLLTLFGKSNGDTLWGINHYKDGSGGYMDVVPCRNLEEAERVYQDIFNDRVDDWRNGKPNTRLHHLIGYIKDAPFPLVVPEDLEGAIDAEKQRRKDAAIKELEEKISSLKNPTA